MFIEINFKYYLKFSHSAQLIVRLEKLVMYHKSDTSTYNMERDTQAQGQL